MGIIKENNLSPLKVLLYLRGGYFMWWDSLDEGTRLSPTWEIFEELFSNKWIKDTKREDMYTI